MKHFTLNRRADLHSLILLAIILLLSMLATRLHAQTDQGLPTDVDDYFTLTDVSERVPGALQPGDGRSKYRLSAGLFPDF